MTKDPETKEFIMILQFADLGSLRRVLSNDFNKISWRGKIKLLQCLIADLRYLHRLGHCHRNLHSGNILLNKQDGARIYFAEFGLCGPASKPRFDDKIYGVLPYVA